MVYLRISKACLNKKEVCCQCNYIIFKLNLSLLFYVSMFYLGFYAFFFLLKLYWAYLNLRNYLFLYTKYKATSLWNIFVQFFCQYVWKSSKTYSSSLLFSGDTFQDPHWMVEAMDSTKARMPETGYMCVCVCVSCSFVPGSLSDFHGL